MPLRPVLLGPNTPETFYRGSGAAAVFRSAASGAPGPMRPEDWIASTTTRHGQAESGLSVLPGVGVAGSGPAGEQTLRAAIEGDPVAWLGAHHVERYGSDSRLLVKLIDTGQRLPVHAHPDRRFASEHWGDARGKTEAWLIVSARPGAEVHLGFRSDVDQALLERWCREQRHSELLGAMHRLAVRPGDTVFVPAGVPHSIGEGILLLELQEPTDYSVFLEWEGFGLARPEVEQLGLPWSTIMRSIDLGRLDDSRLQLLRSGRGTQLFPSSADAFFRAETLSRGSGTAVTLEAGYGVIVLLAGSAELRWAGASDVLSLHRGDAVLVPDSAGRIELSGEFSAVRARPPA